MDIVWNQLPKAAVKSKSFSKDVTDMRNARLNMMLSLTLAGIASAFPANAAERDEPIRYNVRKGDTLVDLGEKYLLRADLYKAVQQQNRIRNPRAIPVGTVLSIPRNLLKFKPANARLVSVRGQVSAGGTAPATNGLVVGEGATLATAASSFATLQLDDGSRVSLPSNSNVRIRRLRSYVLGGSLDYDFDVDKGGMRSSVTKHKSTDDRYRVRTPKAVSAVRGTDFQSRFETDTNSDFAEVVEGALAVDAGGRAESVGAGNGLAVSATGVVVREAMLGEAALVQPGKLQADRQVRFEIQPSEGASAYRLSIAADAGFIEQVADVVTSTGKAEFADIKNGNYFIRVRAKSTNGIEGKPATFAFKRRLNSVSASAGQGDAGYVFRWFGEGEGKRQYHFQLFRNATDSTAMIDEAALDSDRIIISDLPSGDYFWRVGAVQYLDGEAGTNWTATEKLTVSN